MSLAYSVKGSDEENTRDIGAKVQKHRDENGEDADLSNLEDAHIKFEVWDAYRNAYMEYSMDEETKKFLEEELLAPDDDANRNVH